MIQLIIVQNIQTQKNKQSRGNASALFFVVQILIYRGDYIFARDSIGHPAGHEVSFLKKSPRDSIVSLCHSGGSATTDRISERTQGLLQNDMRGDSIESRLGSLQNDNARRLTAL